MACRYLAQLPGDMVVRIHVARELRVGSAVLITGHGLFEVVQMRYAAEGSESDDEVTLAHWPSVTDAFIGQIARSDPFRAPMRSLDVAEPSPAPGLVSRLWGRLRAWLRR